ncbi:hypothetical protein JCM10450v2_002959 [Rhodotorula kratochvilovae]
MKTIKVSGEPLLDIRCFLGEGPIYQPETDELHFLDIERSEVHHYNCTTKAHEVDVYAEHIACIRLRADQPGFIAAADSGFALLPPRAPGSSHASPVPVPFLARLPSSDYPASKMFNDGEVDTLGRFLAGTKPARGEPMEGKREEVMWRVNGVGKVDKVMQGLGMPNGLGFSADEKTMYYTDTVEDTIFTYDYDTSTGTFDNRRPFHSPSSSFHPGGHPDGLLVDAASNVYSARFNGGKVVRFTPAGEADLEIVFDEAWNVTACELGGKDGSTLFVTTASLAESGDDEDEELVRKYGEKSGAVWAVDLSGEVLRQMSAPPGPARSPVPPAPARAPPPFLRRPSSVSSSSFASTATSSFSEASSESGSSSSDDDSDDDQTEGYWSSSGLSGDDSRLLSRLDLSLHAPSHANLPTAQVQSSSARTASPVARSNLRLSLAVLRARQSLTAQSYDALAASLKALSAALPSLPSLARAPAPGADNALGVFVPTLARLAEDVRAALRDEGERGREFRRTKLAREDAKALVGLKQRWAGGGGAGGKGKGRETDSLEWVGVVEAAVAQNPSPDFLADPAFAALTPALLTSLEAFLLPSSLPRISLSNLGLTDVDLIGWPALRRLEEVAGWYFSFVVGEPEEARARARKALDGVKSVDLSKNKLTTFPHYLCRLFPNLETLSLSHTQFPHLPPWVTLFSSLRRLRTHGNRLVSPRKALKPLARPHTNSRSGSRRERVHPKHAGTRADVRDVLPAVRAVVLDAPLDELLPSAGSARARSLFSLAAELVHAQLAQPGADLEDVSAFLPPHLYEALVASYTCASCGRFVLPSSASHLPPFTERAHHLDPGISLPARLPPPVPLPALASPAATPPRALFLSAAERPATLEQRLLLALLARLDAPPPPPRPPRPRQARRGSEASLSSLASARHVPPRRERERERDRAPVLPTLVLGGSGAEKSDWRFCALCAAAHLGLEEVLALRAAAEAGGEDAERVGGWRGG